MIFNKYRAGLYFNSKYKIVKENGWWKLWQFDNESVCYDIYCAMFKSLEKAIDGAELLDKLDRKANKRDIWTTTNYKIGSIVRIKLPNTYNIIEEKK